MIAGIRRSQSYEPARPHVFGGQFVHKRAIEPGVRQDNDNLPSTRWWYKFTDTTGFNENLGASVNLNRVSDDRYFEDFGRGLYSSAISFLPSSLSC